MVPLESRSVVHFHWFLSRHFLSLPVFFILVAHLGISSGQIVLRWRASSS